MTFYDLLLHLYPKSFRVEYGAEMRRVFQRRRDAGTSGLGLVIAALVDVVPNAARVQADILGQDLRFAARSLSRAPGFTFTAIVVSALGIGATTAAFSIADHVLFRSLPYVEPERLVRIWASAPGGYLHTDLSPANYRDFKLMSRSFEQMGAFGSRAVNLGGDGEPARLEGQWVTSEVLAMLGVPALVGRTFGKDDDRPGAPDGIVLSFGLWQSRFGASASAIGKRILLDDTPHEIIGVMPPNFRFPNRDSEFWVGKRFTDADYEERDDNYVYSVARLKKGVSAETAQSDMTLVAAQLERIYPENAHLGATVDGMRDTLSAEARMLPLALLGAAACVLLIACTNLTNLLLARAMLRRKELAVRTSLGAGRDRLVRQLLTESLLLAGTGGALGLLIATSAIPVLARLVPNGLPIAELPALDFRLMAFSLVLTALTGIAFGVLPAARSDAGDSLSGLQEGARAGVGGRREDRRTFLVAAEVMGSVVLLVCCGLLLRALWRVQSIDPGFQSNGVITLRTALPLPRYGPTLTRVQFYDRVLAEVRALPGVSAAGYASGLPMVTRGGIWGAIVPGETQDPGALPPASARFVTPGFFKTLGIPIRSGRDIAESDSRETLPVAVVSQGFADRHWPKQDPLGRQFKFGPAGDRTVVGVVGDIRVRGLERSSEPQVYLSYQQVADNSIIGYTPKDLVVRTTVAQRDLMSALRAIVQRADPQQPISNVRALEDIVGGETAPRRTQVTVLAAFAAVAFMLAAIGLHGVLSFTVTSRTQEIGVRMALGAGRRDILSMILRDSVRMAAIGLTLGLFAAYGAARGMQTLLAGLDALDVPTFSAALLLAGVMTMLGSFVPAMRAIHIDPTKVMRNE